MAVSGIVGLLSLCLIVGLLSMRSNPQPQIAEKKQPEREVVAEKKVIAAPIEQQSLPEEASPLPVHTVDVQTSEDLLENLRVRNLWDLEEDASITPVLFSRFPQDLKSLDTETKKKAFISTMLPISLIALAEVENEKEMLLSILEKLGGENDELVFDDSVPWPEHISAAEKEMLHHLALKYRTNSKKALMNRINVLPVSLILAQGALESSWGSSRFAVKGNNLFGIWTWGSKGITPAKRKDGSSHKVAMYDSLLDSVRAYVLMLNRLPAYASLRKLRRQSTSSVSIADGLLYYSERRKAYIRDVKQVIADNELQKFDSFRLATNYQLQPPETLRLVSLMEKGNAKL